VPMLLLLESIRVQSQKVEIFKKGKKVIK